MTSNGNGRMGTGRGPGARAWRASLRLRIGGWSVGVIAATVGMLIVGGIRQERVLLLESEAGQAQALLEHLARMPEFRGDLTTVRAHVDHMRESLDRAGGELLVGPSGEVHGRADGGHVLASIPLPLREGPFEMAYRGDGRRVRAALRRAVRTHLVYGLGGLVALVGGIEWILRRRLLAPLRALSHQLARMRDGGGWFLRVPLTDGELAELASAVAGLGPGLEGQVREWIGAERRAGLALTAQYLRKLREPVDRASRAAVDLRDLPGLAPEGRPRLETLLADLGQVSGALAAEEQGLSRRILADEGRPS